MEHFRLLDPVVNAAIRRKAGAVGTHRPEWKQAYVTFVTGLSRARFCGLVLDYDGTLCDEARRYTGIGPEVAGMVAGLLEKGLIIGVATGRGGSVSNDLRTKLRRSLWSQVVVGYHNGFQVTTLDDDNAPSSNQHPCSSLGLLVQALVADPRLRGRIRLTPRFALVSVEPVSPLTERCLWDSIQEVIRRLGLDGLGFVAARSTYSIDILAPGAFKRNVVQRVRDMIGAGDRGLVLCVGDRGQWPGNDYELLNEPYSLSVDEVSQNPRSCWNLAPPGLRGEAALLWHLRTAVVRDGALFLDPAACQATVVHELLHGAVIMDLPSPSEAK